MSVGREAQPLRKLDLNSNPDKILDDFKINAGKIKDLIELNPDFEDIISKYKDPKSPQFKPFSKALVMLRNAAKQRKFALVPMIARFKENSDQTHHLRNLLASHKEIKIVFVEPEFEVEGIIYAYKLFIPIPNDMLGRNPTDLLKEHWNMISETIPKKFLTGMIKRFTPLHTINRVYGWDAAYMAYEVAIADDGTFWSPPLVNSPFNGVQPFVALEEGEFAIFERDETESAKSREKQIKTDIERRTEANPYIEFEVQESIEIPPEFIATTIDYADPQFNLNESARDLGGKLGSITIDKRLPETTKQLFELMQAQVHGTPQFVFTEDERKKYMIRNR